MPTVNDTNIFTAAVAGALAGMAASSRQPTVTDPTDPSLVGYADIAGAYASAFDAYYASFLPALPVDVLSVSLAETLSQSVWLDRDPLVLPVPDNVLDPLTYVPLVEALVAIIVAEEAFYTANAITPPQIVVLPPTPPSQPTGFSSGVGTAVPNVLGSIVGGPLNVTVAAGQKLILIASVSSLSSASPPANDASFELFVDGVSVQSVSVIVGEGVLGTNGMIQFETGPLAVGPHTYDLQAVTALVGAVTNWALQYLVVSA